MDDDALFCRECGTKVEVAEQVAAPQPPAPQVLQTQIPQPQVEATATYNENDTYVEVEKDHKLYYIIGGVVAAVLLAVGGWWFYNNRSSDNNPLGVQKPKWEKFVMVNAKGVMLFKEADTASPNLKSAVECVDCDIPQEELLWSGEKAPRGYHVDDYGVEINSVYPVIDESEDWYKVYIGTGTIREAYLQKK